MKIEDPRYTLLMKAPAYYALEFEVEDRTYSINPEIKPGVLARGQVYFNGGLVEDPGLLRLSTAFMIECDYGRTKEGPAVLEPDPGELRELGDRLSEYAPPGWSILAWLDLFTVKT